MFETNSQRLIVAIDLKIDSRGPPPREQAQKYLEYVCDQLTGLNVTVKINTVARILGATSVEFIHDQGLSCFLDLKLFDIGNTLMNDVSWITYYSPLMLTVSERVKPFAFNEIKNVLKDTLVLPVGPLTDLDDGDFQKFGEVSRKIAVKNFFKRIWNNGSDGAICAPSDIKLAPEKFLSRATIVTPAVKPKWTLADDNSINALTPAEAISAGASAIVVGRGITAQKNIRYAAERTLDEINQALSQ